MKISLLFLLISSMVWAKDIVVVEIDSGVDTSHYEIAQHLIEINPDDNSDPHGHGTHIAGLILEDTCPQVKLLSCRAFYLKRIGNFSLQLFPFKNSVDCFQRALQMNAKYVNFSGGGEAMIPEEKEAIRQLSENGTKIVVAAGNENNNSLHYYPAGYGFKGLIVVGNLDKDGKRNKSSNYGFPGMVWEMGTDIESTAPNGDYAIMSGTSQAAAIHMNHLLRKECSKLR